MKTLIFKRLYAAQMFASAYRSLGHKCLVKVGCESGWRVEVI